jgi:hypothetical protein
MKFTIIWHDAEDDQSGEPFEVEADFPEAAYEIADKCLREIAPRYVANDIECLKDIDGNYYYPQFFLKER